MDRKYIEFCLRNVDFYPECITARIYWQDEEFHCDIIYNNTLIPDAIDSSLCDFTILDKLNNFEINGETYQLKAYNEILESSTSLDEHQDIINYYHDELCTIMPVF